jgi:NitT/TauT family transport system substrate-binding protein
MNAMARRKKKAAGMTRGFASLLCAVAILALSWTGQAAAQSLTPVRYASVGGTTDAGIYIAEDFGFFKDAGIALHYQRLDSAAALLGAIATGHIDVAGISLTPGLFAAQSRNIGLRVVGDKESILPGFAATQLVARSDSGGGEADILRRLKGKPVAVSGKTSASYFLLASLLKKYGMAPADLRIVELSYPAMVVALTNHAVDAAVMLEPFLSQALRTSGVRSVSDFTEIVPASGASIVPIVYGEAFAANRKPADAFMLAYTRAVHVYLDAFRKGTEKDKVIAAIARHTGFDRKAILATRPVGFAPDQKLDMGFLDAAQAFFVAQHYLPAPADTRRLVDPSFAAAAVRVLGPYR